MKTENLMDIYNRTYRNCEFYRAQGNKAALLNEIGVLRGIVYCLEAIVGSDFVYQLVSFSAFKEMIDEQQRMKEEGC